MSFRTLSDLDDDVKPVSFHTVGASSGGRVVTPSKAITIPRSTSANNRSSSAQKKDRTLYRALVETEVEKRAPSRNPSRRKQRQLENDNLVDLHRAMIEKGLCIDFDDDEEDGKIRHPHNRAKFSMRINFKSLFSELFEEKNCLVREEFRTCAIGTSSSSSQQAHVRRNIPIRKDQWNEAEACFYLIEVRLRNVVVRSLESEDLCHFVRSLECILLYYIAQQNIPSQVPLALVDKLESPLETTGGSLIVFLKDSSFYRLLLHATCQFYGLRSKSITGKGGLRKTIITLPASRRDHGMAVQEGLSLVGYIVANKLKGGDSMMPPASPADAGGISPCVQLETVYPNISEAAIVSPRNEEDTLTQGISTQLANVVFRADSKSSDESSYEHIYQQQDHKEWVEIDMVKLTMNDTPSDE